MESPHKTLQDNSVIYHKEPSIYEQFTNAEDIPDYAFSSLLAEFKGKDILDVGCGTGKYVLKFAPHVKSIFGFDAAAAEIELAREKTKSFLNVTLVVGDALNIKLPKEKFDIVFSSFVLSTMPKLGQPNEDKMNAVLANIIPSLKPSGKIFLVEGGTGDEFDSIRYWQVETAIKFREWVAKSGFKLFREIDTYFEFKNTEKAKEALGAIWGEKASNQINKPTITHKMLIFEKSK